MPEKTAPATLSFTVRRIVDAAVDAVWDAWSNPDKVKEWWGPKGFTAPLCRMDFREGGTTLVSMKSPDFGELFNTWTYSRIVPKKRIEFVMRFSDSEGSALDPAAIGMPPGVPPEVPHVVTLDDLGDSRTEMTITEHGYTSQQAAELSKAGQEQVVDKMAASLERHTTAEDSRQGETMSLDTPADARVVLAGLGFPESPRWHDGRLWLSDWATGEVLALERDGGHEVISQHQSFPLCIDHLPDGRLLMVSSSERRLLRREQDGTIATHADLSGLGGTHPWNDIAVDGRGNAYVNNIGFDFPEGPFAPGLIALVSADGSVRQVADGLAFPNGMAVTPDDRTLIVAESYANQLTAFDIGLDGSLGNRRVWASTADDHPDGICLDVDGAVWYGDVGNRRCVRVREGGEILQAVSLDRGCFACALGGPDGRRLYMVVNRYGEEGADQSPAGQVVSIEVERPGVGRP